jgi:hypothetical protein
MQEFTTYLCLLKNCCQASHSSLPSPKLNTPHSKWGTFYLLIADCLSAQNIGGAKELLLLL